MTVVMRRFEYNNKLKLKKKNETKESTIDDDILQVINAAASKIQAIVKGFLIRNVLKKHFLYTNNAQIIQKYLKRQIKIRKKARIELKRQKLAQKYMHKTLQFMFKLIFVMYGRNFYHFIYTTMAMNKYKLEKQKEFVKNVSTSLPFLIIILKRKILNDVKNKLQQKMEHDYFIRNCKNKEKAAVQFNTIFVKIEKDYLNFYRRFSFNRLNNFRKAIKINMVIFTLMYNFLFR